MPTYGYARISAPHADRPDPTGGLESQCAQLQAAGVDQIHTDIISGASEAQSRPGLDALLRAVQPEDTIVIVSLDRIARSVPVGLRVIQDLAQSGVHLKSSGRDWTPIPPSAASSWSSCWPWPNGSGRASGKNP